MDSLNVQVNDQLNKQFSGKTKKFFTGPKIIFLILGLVLLIEVIYAVRVLTSNSPPPLPQKTTVQPPVGKISLNAPKTSYKINEAVPVSVLIDTAGYAVGGVDLIVRFDPKILEASVSGLVKGTILEEYPAMSVDSVKGLISISGISSTQNGFTGKGQFATLNLRAKASGKTSLTIDFNGKGQTADSNLVESATSKDILETVNNLEVNVQ
ncbi:MAG: cohesin domain-containing protein [Candidatus Daviesbacteria bacterium]|nr:cohesin domain-containing protein [Candidatus Daviesbacteria bacterium]